MAKIKSMKYLIVGLGNPGKQYVHTRHNIGFLAIDILSQHYHIPVDKEYKNSLIGITKNNRKKIILMKPLTYMNLSGEMVQKVMATHKIPLSHLVVIYDDIDFALGKLKIKKNGSSGGHKGVQSIIDSLQNNNFIRIRMGIHSENRQDLPLDKFVLSNFTKEEQKIVLSLLKQVPDIIDIMINQSIDKAMNEFN